jgi:acetyl esterase/lipase
MKQNITVLEPTTAQFIETLVRQGGKPIYQLSIADARKILDDLQREPVEKPQATIEDHMIPDTTGKQISIRIVRPVNDKNMLPALMYFHGGGWILGNKETHDRLIRELAVAISAAVVFVNYTPSPEARYPIAIEEAYEATHYIAQHGANLAIDTHRIAVAGDSVGGNMATVVALLAKERGGPSLCYQVLFYPVTNARFDTRSYIQFAEGPWLTKAGMEWFWDAYEPDKTARNQPKISPLQATLEQLQGLPPTLIVTDENDVLRDEGEAYAHKLMQAGVRVTAIRCLGTIHDFVMLNALADTPATRAAIDIATSALKKVFAQ